uniref:L-type lectin-like domain-containing protein n=1 Tax=Strongyloides stercoralis TaxID=6248 RepID=A0AAF5DI73_STRER
MKNLLTFSFITFCLFFLIKGNNNDEIVSTSIHEYRGYYRREYSLIKPYHSSSSHIPYWNIIGDTEVNNDEVRLTRDEKGKSGIIYNKSPVLFRDWEVMLSFSITGTKERLYGDGMAIWYVKEINRGPAFDTYQNDNKGSDYQFPIIYGMINNGNKEYNIDNDGTSTRLGQRMCSAYLRNQGKGSTNLLLRYFNDTLSIYTDVDGEGKWKKCFDVKNVFLPTGYYFAVSGHTGDLHDTHDILAFRMYELNLNRPNTENVMSSHNMIPYHLDEKENILETKNEKSFFYNLKVFILICITISILIFAVYYGLEYYKNRIAKSRKRFY